MPGSSHSYFIKCSLFAFGPHVHTPRQSCAVLEEKAALLDYLWAMTIGFCVFTVCFSSTSGDVFSVLINPPSAFFGILSYRTRKEWAFIVRILRCKARLRIPWVVAISYSNSGEHAVTFSVCGRNQPRATWLNACHCIMRNKGTDFCIILLCYILLYSILTFRLRMRLCKL